MSGGGGLRTGPKGTAVMQLSRPSKMSSPAGRLAKSALLPDLGPASVGPFFCLKGQHMAYDNSNSGILSRNDRKESDTHPDYTGFVDVEGVEYWVSAWVREGKEGSKMEGRKYFSLKLKLKDGQRVAKPANEKASPRVGLDSDPDDDIPF